MPILFFNPVGEIGGAERVVLLLLAELKKTDAAIEPRLLLGSDGPLRAAAERLGVVVEVLPFPASMLTFGDSQLSGGSGRGGLLQRAGVLLRAAIGIPAGIAYLFRLRRKLRELAPDIIHSNGIKTHLVAALARPKTSQLVWHIHDFLGDRALVGRLMRSLAGRAAIAVANSESVRDDAASILRRLPVRTIYNGIDVAHYSPAAADGALLDRLAGLSPPPSNVVRVGLVATYARWKGHETFLRAAAEVVRRDPKSPLRFYIVGGPIYRTAGSQYSEQELRALAAELGVADRVGFVPFQPDSAPIYRALDVVVHASTRREPFGLTIVEAMSCGRAVITSAAGGAAEIAEPGVNALTFSLGNAAELAAAMMALADDAALRRRLGEGGRRTAVERFAAPVMAEKFAELYAELSPPANVANART